jgi:holo-[acyl-carrier protein] synthase
MSTMILGLGTDLIEVTRIERSLREHGGRFERRIFTADEIAACAGRADRVQALAARFAAKEACLKALGTGWAEGLAFRQVEVVRAGNGLPSIRLHDEAEARARKIGVRSIHVSLSHQPGVAGAVVLLEG